MSSQAMCFPTTVDALGPVIETAEEFGANHINIQPNVRPLSGAGLRPVSRGLAASGGADLDSGLRRDPSRRMTTDLFFTLQLLDCFPI